MLQLLITVSQIYGTLVKPSKPIERVILNFKIFHKNSEYIYIYAKG